VHKTGNGDALFHGFSPLAAWQAMLLFGYNTNGFAHHRLEDALTILAELGYRSVAITLDYHALNPFDPNLPQQLAAVRELLAQLKVRSVIETGARFLLDPRRKHRPTLVDAQVVAGPREEFLQRAIDIAQELGSDAVSFWSGATDENVSAEMKWNRLVRMCKRLCKYAAGRRVRLAFEPEPGMFVDTMSRYATLARRVDHPLFGLTLDVGHLHCQGETPIAEHLRRCRDVLWNVHIEDMRQGVHDHLMFGDGEIDFGPVLRTLEEIGYSNGVHVELSRHSHNAVETARQALAFLQAVA
jgi:sugar phosphate isomerase/epimerase